MQTKSRVQHIKSQKNLVDFINELTHFVAYDTRKEEADNHFEKLYFECIEESCTGKNYNYHFDDFIGHVGYDVELSNFGINHRFLSPTSCLVLLPDGDG